MSTPIAATTTLAGTDGLHIAADTRGPDGRSGPPIVATPGWATTRTLWTSRVDDLCTDHPVPPSNPRPPRPHTAPPTRPAPAAAAPPATSGKDRARWARP